MGGECIKEVLLETVGFEDSGYTGSAIRQMNNALSEAKNLANDCIATYQLEALHHWS